ncbi:CPBP family intramembrane glutamic endopeptidase [Kordia jejudonensis]|uniref:CPBP family intramembrane glutamic endopeptidase n=1 Tax=Kordia jejudonensis TaxID=1348245 RepID=UPI0006296189|nr:CPBP family intramembrane glutamic endopeptidase [Kordia jejudonensis]
MKINQINFIRQSYYGRNKWWTYGVMVLISLLCIVILNMLMNKVFIPLLKTSSALEIIGKENISYFFIFLVFGALVLILKLLHKKLHFRPYSSLTNGLNDQKFRWKLYGKGILQWGIIIFPAMLITDWDAFINFTEAFNLTNFAICFVLATIAFFFQTLWEELIFRSYLFQGLSRKFNLKIIPHIIIGILFAFVHLGYGIQHFIFSFIFSIVFTLIVIKDNGIERATGMHFINNFLISIFFRNINEELIKEFNWTIDWVDGSIELLAFTALLFITGLLKFSKKTPKSEEIEFTNNKPILNSGN